METPSLPTKKRRLKHAVSALALLSALATLPAYVQTSSGETNSPPPAPPLWSILEDADQDGMTDVDELLWGMDPLNPEDGLSDLDGDEIDLAWEFAIGTNPDVADTDMDDWSDAEEYLLYGTDPLDPLSFPLSDAPDGTANTALESSTPEPEAVLAEAPPPPSLSNGDFSSVDITTWKSMATSTQYQGKGFVWNAGTVTSWTAYVGTTVEVWDAGGEKFVELDGSPSSYGIKQEIANPKAGGYVIAWRQSGRNCAKAGSDSYRVKVYYMNGTSEVPIGQSTEFTNLDKMQWKDNAFAFQITPAQLTAAGTKPVVYVAFIPTGTLNTYGTLIDKVALIPMEFKLRNSADYTKGWDDTGTEPWTSVGVSKTNSIVKFVGRSNDFELVVDSGSTNFLSIANETTTSGETTFEIKGTAASSATGAKIIVREKANHSNKVGTLNVHVLPSRDIHFNVFHASDEGPGRVPKSAIPAGVPTPAAIEAELNSTFWDQANVHFFANTINNPTIVSNCDGSFASNGACYYGYKAAGHGSLLVQDHILNQIYARASALGINTANSLNIVFVKDVIQHNPREDVHGITGGQGFFRYPFIDSNAVIQTTAHETGHALELSTRTDPNDKAGNQHDPGPDPKKETPLMGRRVGKPRGYWLRQEYWRKANDSAGANYR